MHVMLDLETMGNTPDAPIVAIGACRFDKNGVSWDTFYRKITLQSSVDAGAKIDASTVLWWLQQEAEARAELYSGDFVDEWDALCDFANWINVHGDVDGIWGNGAAFDNVILAQGFRRHRQNAPWPFWKDRCYRTIKSLSDVEMKREGTHHNALDDAISQAKHLIAIWASSKTDTPNDN